MQQNRLLPPSVTSIKINIVGTFVFLFGLIFLTRFPLSSSSLTLIFLMLCWFLPILLLEILFLPHVRQAMSKQPDKIYLKQAFFRYLGLLLTLACIAFAYWVFPEYHLPFYFTWWQFLQSTLPFFLLLALPYFLWISDNMPIKEDPYYQIGLLLFGKTSQLNAACLAEHARSWLIKAFFLPLMLSYFWNSIQGIQKYSSSGIENNLKIFANQIIHPHQIDHVIHSLSLSFGYLFNFCWALIFLVDVGIVSVGYATTLRILDNQIRSTEPTLLGWVVALICYMPFNAVFSHDFLNYNSNGYTWGTWLFSHDVLYVVWGSLILLLCLIYLSASITFGLRFSNLTHRGILTNGPYRFFKHPAYLAKNVSWWLISIPFIPVGSHYADTIRNMAMLLAFNFIYYMRAKTEERHLSHDPTYQRYLAYFKKK